ncbi:MAG TPA: tail fiber domain-containing protein, partial [Candidatus Paceibacterota bacterium]|nr:tail fiber domain-containing protein [Candidatus Paceibacterota bacterium]
MTILGTGNVGIGTTTPDTKLSVNGTTKFGNGVWPELAIGMSGTRMGVLNDTENPSLIMSNMSNTAAANNGSEIYLGARKTTGLADWVGGMISGYKEFASGVEGGYLAFKTVNSAGTLTERMRINTSGSVAIGTTTPQAELHIEGGSFNTRLLVNQSGADGGMMNAFMGVQVSAFSDTSGVIRFKDKGANVAANEFFVIENSNASNDAAAGLLNVKNNAGSILSVKHGGTIFASASLGAESGGDNYLCIDPTTHEITNGGADCGASSERYKENIKDLGYGLKDVLKMRPVSYKFRETGRDSIGFIAEEVINIIPEIVETKDGLPESIDYNK